MNKFILASTILLASFAAQAEMKLSCDFTEPFWDVSYDSTTSKLIINKLLEGTVIYKNASVVKTGETLFEIRSQENVILMKLDLNGKGSNGMSDTIYPFDAELIDEDGQRSLWGGCESDQLQATKDIVDTKNGITE